MWIPMRRISFGVLVLVTGIVAASCGSSSVAPSSPSSTTTSGGSGGGSGAGPTGQTAPSSDSSFDDNDWETEVLSFGNGGTGSAGHLTYLGQAGADYRQITIDANSGGQVAVFSIYIKSGAQYFPSSSGAIFTVDYSEQSILLSGGGSGQYSAPAIRQNGKYYTLTPDGGAFATPDATWTTHPLHGLTQNSFRTLDSASDHPDFSANGSRIEVGFMRMVSASSGGSGKIVGGIDDWHLTLNR
jgi:hypothetical protein